MRGKIAPTLAPRAKITVARTPGQPIGTAIACAGAAQNRLTMVRLIQLAQAVRGLNAQLVGIAANLTLFGPNRSRVARFRRLPNTPASLFGRHVYTGPEGTMAYWLYRPAGTARHCPLLIMLHGCMQTPRDFAVGTGMNACAEQKGCIIAYPSQQPSSNLHRCWNWFRPGDQHRGNGEPALTAAVTRAIMAEQSVDPERVYVAGFSAGGAAALIMSAAYPDLYAAVGVHSGLARGSATSSWSALNAMRGNTQNQSQAQPSPFVPVFIIHGDGDRTIAASNSTQIAAMASASYGPTRLVTRTRTKGFPGGLSYSSKTYFERGCDPVIEHWTVYGGAHGWSGGNRRGSFTQPSGPDASQAMLAFLLSHSLKQAAA